MPEEIAFFEIFWAKNNVCQFKRPVKIYKSSKKMAKLLNSVVSQPSTFLHNEVPWPLDHSTNYGMY